MAKAIQSAPEAVAPSGIMGKFVYLGERASYGPYRGLTAEAVASSMDFTDDEARKDFLDNLKAW
jgi:hypothetical protein